MEFFDKIRRFENLHIVFWLIKDTCWMLEIKWLGAIMILPTISVAALIICITRHSREAFVNLAILCWICANSFWMLMEFFNNNLYKNYAGIPFSIGFIFISIYYLVPVFKTKN